MRYTFTGKNMTVTDAIKEHTTKKLDKMNKLLPADAEALVTYSVVKSDQKIEVTIPLPKRILRAEVANTDMYAAIDAIVDILEKQLKKYKGRLRDRSRRDSSFKEEFTVMFTESSGDEESGVSIEKIKRFALKPMDSEEAVMEMELLGHNFYVFRNGRSDEVNVVYKRQNGTYGLIEPEY